MYLRLGEGLALPRESSPAASAAFPASAMHFQWPFAECDAYRER